MAGCTCWLDGVWTVEIKGQTMSWMKPGEFECVNGCKAVVWGRVPEPNDTPKYPWSGYVEMPGAPNHIKMSWSDEGMTCADGGLQIKCPIITKYAAFDMHGSSRGWSQTLRAAVASLMDVKSNLELHSALARADGRCAYVLSCDFLSSTHEIVSDPQTWLKTNQGVYVCGDSVTAFDVNECA